MKHNLRKRISILTAILIFCTMLVLPLKIDIRSTSLSNFITVKADTGNTTKYSKTKPNTTTQKSSSSRSSSSGSGSSSSLPTPMLIIVLIVFAGLYLYNKKKKSGNSTTNQATSSDHMDGNDDEYTTPEDIEVEDYTRDIETEIKRIDKNFSTYEFIGWTKEVFMSIQEAWSERDWSKIRPFEKEELFKIHEKQLAEYIRLNRINVMERISVGEAYLHEYNRDNQYEYLTVCLSATFNDYIIDSNTRQVIEGFKNTRYHASYLMTFMRNVGVKTDTASGNLSTKQCPNCGAPVQITSAGKCEYCDTIITTGEHDWVLSDHVSINNNTKLDGGVHVIPVD